MKSTFIIGLLFMIVAGCFTSNGVTPSDIPDNSIKEWQIIPPYPQINMSLNDYLVGQKTPMTMVFKQVGLSKTLDENKLWIIEEQKQQKRSK